MIKKQKKYLSGQFAKKSDVGKVRLTNEDRVLAMTNLKGNVLLVVCDGMGGASKGDLASTIATEFLKDEFENKKGFLSRASAYYWLTSTIKKANKKIYDEAFRHPEYKGMGTTLTAILIVNSYMVVAQIGDSRAYTIKNNKLVQLTEDQTYVGYLYRTGQITEDEMKTHPKRHVLMNALGIYPSLEVDARLMNYEGERFLLCSDGLYNNVSNRDIESILKNEDSVDEKADELIALANSNGGSDNIGVVLWEVFE